MNKDGFKDTPPADELDPAAPAKGPARMVFTFPFQRPVVTWTLCAVIAVMYLAEMGLGGPDQLWLLSRMGAMTPDALEKGELWRLLSSSFLHGNFAHVGFALMILWSLGGFIERIVGGARLLILYVLAALLGGVAAALFGGGAITVGSSGALWGLLVGHAMLAYRPGGLIPEPLADAMKSPAKKNLALNVLVSFLPGVSMAAHAGGAVAGVALMGTGLLTLGLKASEPGRTGTPAKLIAAPLGLLLAASLPAALSAGQVLSLGGPQELRAHPIEATGMELQLPALLGDAQPDEQGQVPDLSLSSRVYGEFLHDPFVVEVFAVPGLEDELAMRQAVDEITQGVDASLSAQGWTAKDGAPRGEKAQAMAREAAQAKGLAAPWGERHFEAPNGVRLDMYLLGGEGALLRLDVVRWPDLSSPWDELAREVPASVRLVE